MPGWAIYHQGGKERKIDLLQQAANPDSTWVFWASRKTNIVF